ncbi:MAG: adenosylcobinamide-GDP ribazoletransferase [Desulfobulbaceae bacterium]|nr:adenosylcobinamide-GDP ribazoletransferase [Desulfobulbaceae bacterium]
MSTESSLNSGLKIFLLRFCAALRFLTIVPVAWRADRDGDYFNQCLPFFPLIGMLIGTVGALGGYLLLFIFPPPVVAIVAITYLAFISGCLHLDGLSDSGDGLLSSRPRETSLTIMKDSRVGAMGVIVVVLLLLAKFAALSTLDPVSFCAALFFMPLTGRCAILFTMATVKYARPEGGLGSLFYTDSSKGIAVFWCLLLALLLFLYIREWAFLTLVMVLAGALFFNRICTSHLGGATGDTLGANCEIAEMLIAISFSASFL